MGFSQVVALVNPRAYFLALAAAVARYGLMDRWVLCRPPAHPRYLLRAVREVAPVVRVAAGSRRLTGGVYPIPALYPILQREAKMYAQRLPSPWKENNRLLSLQDTRARWDLLVKAPSR